MTFFPELNVPKSDAYKAGWLYEMVWWAVNPERQRDAEYRLAELDARWQDYLRRFSED